MDAWNADTRAAIVLSGLGFKPDDFHRATKEFSGGWRMRAAIAGVLVSEPDVLLLDEPTNYLDLEGAAWLEGYIQRYPYTVIMVSHDREMLNRSVTHSNRRRKRPGKVRTANIYRLLLIDLKPKPRKRAKPNPA